MASIDNLVACLEVDQLEKLLTRLCDNITQGRLAPSGLQAKAVEELVESCCLRFPEYNYGRFLGIREAMKNFDFNGDPF